MKFADLSSTTLYVFSKFNRLLCSLNIYSSFIKLIHKLLAVDRKTHHKRKRRRFIEIFNNSESHSQIGVKGILDTIKEIKYDSKNGYCICYC